MEPKKGVEFKVVMMGDRGVGLKTFLRQTPWHQQPKRYITTAIEPDITTITFQTSCGRITLNIWKPQVNSSPFFCQRDSFFLYTDALLVMFDLNSRLSYKNLPRYVKDVKRVVDKTIPIFVLGNKVDLQEFRVKPKHITYPSKFGYPFFYISAKAQYQVVDVYLTLLRALTGDKELVFTEQFPMIEPQFEINEQRLLAIYQMETAIKINSVNYDQDDF